MAVRDHGTIHPQCVVEISWTPPQGCFKLNTDGSVRTLTNRAAGSGIIRNLEGKWVSGFMANLGDGTITYVELWALREGLSLALQENLQSLLVEIDYKTILTFTQD